MGIQKCNKVSSKLNGLWRLLPHPVGGRWRHVSLTLAYIRVRACALCRLSMLTEGCEPSVKADVCQRTFSSWTCYQHVCFQLLHSAGAGLAQPLVEEANCAGTEALAPGPSAHVCGALIHAHHVSKLSVLRIVAELQKLPLEKYLFGLFSLSVKETTARKAELSQKRLVSADILQHERHSNRATLEMFQHG